MPEILKMFELAQHDRMPEMKVGSGRVHTEFHAEWLAGGAGLLQFGAQVGFANNLRGALLEIGELFVDGRECWHEKGHYKECRRIVARPIPVILSEAKNLCTPGQLHRSFAAKRAAQDNKAFKICS